MRKSCARRLYREDRTICPVEYLFLVDEIFSKRPLCGLNFLTVGGFCGIHHGIEQDKYRTGDGTMNRPVALVTGARQGIGLAIALALADAAREGGLSF